MATAMVSAMTRKAARHDVAMTGEITLRGKVLPIGGVKEKLLAAHRFGLKTIIMSKENEKDLADIPEEVRDDLTIHIVDTIDEVLKFALEPDNLDEAIDAPMPQIWNPDSATPEISTTVE
jgi:ATP-dependent Lon protease